MDILRKESHHVDTIVYNCINCFVLNPLHRRWRSANLYPLQTRINIYIYILLQVGTGSRGGDNPKKISHPKSIWIT